MKILFVTAEKPEADACRRAVLESGVPADVVFSGMGAEATRRTMEKKDLSEYDYVIDAGIAGSFTGAELGAAYNVLEERNWEDTAVTFTGALPLFGNLPCAKGLTVQQMSGDVDLVSARRSLGADVESMEGAAFFEVCLAHGVRHFAELRTISNEVGEIRREKWDINLALDAIYKACLDFLSTLKESR